MMMQVSDASISAWVRRRREESGFPTPRNPSRRRTERQKFEAVRLILDEGRTFAGAAREVGVAPSTARRWAHEAQQQAPRTTSQRANASLGAQAEALRLVAEEGFGPRQVARQLGLSLSAVVGWVRHGNVR